MLHVVADRVKETTASSGTGALVLGGASLGCQSFDVVGSGNTTYYAMTDSSSGGWEVGQGTYTVSGATRSLSRDVLLSSSTGAFLNLGVGTVKELFITPPASRAVLTDNNAKAFGNNLFYRNSRTISQNVLIDATDNVMSAGPLTVADGFTVTIANGGEWVIV